MDLYNVNLDVTYKINNDDTLFRSQLLKAFNININDFDNLHELIEQLYLDIKTREHLFSASQFTMFNNILSKLANIIMSTDKSVGFMVLFSYDYFQYTHMFLKDIIINKHINEEILESIFNVKDF